MNGDRMPEQLDCSIRMAADMTPVYRSLETEASTEAEVYTKVMQLNVGLRV